MFLSIYTPICLFISVLIIYLSISVSIQLLPIYLSVYIAIYLPYLSVCLSIYLSIYLRFFATYASKSGVQPFMFLTSWLWNLLGAVTACIFWTSAPQKWPETVMFLTFLDIGSPKSGPYPNLFLHVDLKTCFAPQRRAIVHFSSGHMAPRPAALASLCLDPPDPQIIGKT